MHSLFCDNSVKLICYHHRIGYFKLIHLHSLFPTLPWCYWLTDSLRLFTDISFLYRVSNFVPDKIIFKKYIKFRTILCVWQTLLLLITVFAKVRMFPHYLDNLKKSCIQFKKKNLMTFRIERWHNITNGLRSPFMVSLLI